MPKRRLRGRRGARHVSPAGSFDTGHDSLRPLCQKRTTSFAKQYVSSSTARRGSPYGLLANSTSLRGPTVRKRPETIARGRPLSLSSRNRRRVEDGRGCRRGASALSHPAHQTDVRVSRIRFPTASPQLTKRPHVTDPEDDTRQGPYTCFMENRRVPCRGHLVPPSQEVRTRSSTYSIERPIRSGRARQCQEFCVTAFGWLMVFAHWLHLSGG